MGEKSNYNPILDERWFKWANWWVNYAPLFKKLALGAAISLEAILLLYSGYFWVDYLVLSRGREARFYEELSQSLSYELINSSRSPQAISVVFSETLPGGGQAGAYDVLAKLSNPNSKHLAFITYQFVVNGEASPPAEAYILNNDERYVIGAGLAKTSSASSELAIKNVRWQRIRELDKFNARKPILEVSEASFTAIGEGDGGALGRVSFAVVNKSSYNFWSVGLMTMLMKNDRNIAARFMTLPEMLSLERRPVSFNIYNVGGGVDKILVVPEVNIADSDIFMTVPGEPIIF